MVMDRLEFALRDRISHVASRFALSEEVHLALLSAIDAVKVEHPFSEAPILDASMPSLSLEPPPHSLDGNLAGAPEAAEAGSGTSEPAGHGPKQAGSPEGHSRPRLARYEDLGLIGMGGMGEVRRVRDRDLNRTMAMKIMRPLLLDNPAAQARFIEEAQATAQLQHPGIVPVHELGRMADGRYYFTMKEIRGRTLSSVLQEVHHASGEASWETGPSGWTFRRLVDAFRKAAESVAYAHSRGVIHRDLKPSNIMVGDFGEVLVVDWGLAKVWNQTATTPDEAMPDTIITHRSQASHLATQMGTVTGTPAYMPPEQARGDIARVGPASDVYALGAILYEILSGSPPYEGENAMTVLWQVLSGPPPRPGRRTASSELSGETILTDYGDLVPEAPHFGDAPATIPRAGPPIPDELIAICERAMAREISDRYPDSSALATAVGDWLDGAQRREQALKIVLDADHLQPEADQLRHQAESLRAEAERLLESIRSFEPIEKKRPAWEQEDEARRLERLSDLKEIQYLQKLQGSLTHAPDLPESHERLAAYYQEKHAEAERSRNVRAAAQFEVLLRAHDRGQHAAYLKGDGLLTLVTDPPGAHVELFRYVERDRRLTPELIGPLGRTPLHRVTLPVGSYLLKLKAPDRPEVLYPVQIARLDHWEGVRPGSIDPFPIYLPTRDELGPHDLYVPAGWFWSGGDPEAYNSLPARRLWVDPYIIRRFPVTNSEYLAFLNDLVARGDEAEALKWAPRDRVTSGTVVYGRDDAGRFTLVPDQDGDVWNPEWPVVQVTGFAARAYAAWEAGRSSLGWRLLSEMEWEKGARGVDGRFFPWGDFADPTWACTQDSHLGRPLPALVDSYPDDISPYGVRGLAGNVRDWTLDVFRREGPPVRDQMALLEEDAIQDGSSVVVRGGTWLTRLNNSRICARVWEVPERRGTLIGFRLARSLAPRAAP